MQHSAGPGSADARSSSGLATALRRSQGGARPQDVAAGSATTKSPSRSARNLEQFEKLTRSPSARSDFPLPGLEASAREAEDEDPSALAKEDPLAAQVWRLYARTKSNLPNGERMENLTWRMMAMTLKKKEMDAALKGDAEAKMQTDSRREQAAAESHTTRKESQKEPRKSHAIPIAPKGSHAHEAEGRHVPASVPSHMLEHPMQDEFHYVRRHVRKTSMDGGQSVRLLP